MPKYQINKKMKKHLIILLFVSLSTQIYSQVALSDSVQSLLLSRHNFYRHVVGSPDLYWSDTLAQAAKQYADEIAQAPYSTDPLLSYGVNIFRSADFPKVDDAMQFWTIEQRYYHGEPMTEKNILRFGHYTQIIWKQTNHLGCAIAQTQGGTYILVCLYAVKGNYIGQKPY